MSLEKTYLEKTYQILATTQRTDATEVLVNGVRRGDASTQTHCIETLARRTSERSHDALIELWGDHSVQIESALADSKTIFFDTVAKRLSQIDVDGKPAKELVEMSVRFRINSALKPLIELSLSHQDTSFRQTCLNAALSLSQYWGHQARRDYPGVPHSPIIERQRLDVTNQLLLVAEDFLSHRCEGLLDALLALSIWSDAALRSVLRTDTPCRAILLRQIRHSSHSSVLELLAGYIQRRSIPEEVLAIMLQRQEDSYRELLLEAITSSPSPITVNNLREFGLPDCLRGGVSMLRELGIDRDAAVAHAYTAAMQGSPETLAVLLEILERQSEHISDGSTLHDAIAVSMARCNRPEMSFWLRGCRSSIMDDPDQATFQDDLSTDDLAAMICTRLIALSQDDDLGVSDHAMDLLKSFNIQNALPVFGELSDEQRVRLGRALMQVDPSTVDVVGDGLRHAVMQKRIDAIVFAQTLGLVDLMIEPIARIAREDHQTARLAATEALGNAHSEMSRTVLEELSTSPLGTIRDLAFGCLEQRGEVKESVSSQSQSQESEARS